MAFPQLHVFTKKKINSAAGWHSPSKFHTQRVDPKERERSDFGDRRRHSACGGLKFPAKQPAGSSNTSLTRHSSTS